MSNNDYSDIAFQIYTVHDFEHIYVASGSGKDVEINDDRYLVIVNERGDRLASKSPGGTWKCDKNIFYGFDPNIPKFQNSVKVNPPGLEND